MSPIERAEADLAEEMILAGYEQASDQDEPQQGHQDPQPEAVAQPEVPQAPQAPQQNDNPNSDTFKSRWEVSQGIIRSQTEQLRKAQEQVDTLLRRVEVLLESKETPTPPSPAPHVPFQDRDELVSEVGADMAEVMLAREAQLEAKWAARTASLEAALNKLAPMAESVNTLQANQQQSESEAFKTRLTERVPAWQGLIRDPGFVDWAKSTTEPITGKTFAVLFDTANNVRPWNLEGMVAIFNQYLGVSASPTPQPKNDPKPIDPRLGHVAPGARGGGSYGGNEPPAPVVSEQEYQEAGDLFVRGKISEADYLKVERGFFSQNRSR